jgi:hypothetical protein
MRCCGWGGAAGHSLAGGGGEAFARTPSYPAWGCSAGRGLKDRAAARHAGGRGAPAVGVGRGGGHGRPGRGVPGAVGRRAVRHYRGMARFMSQVKAPPGGSLLLGNVAEFLERVDYHKTVLRWVGGRPGAFCP